MWENHLGRANFFDSQSTPMYIPTTNQILPRVNFGNQTYDVKTELILDRQVNLEKAKNSELLFVKGPTADPIPVYRL